jgi:small GTP-binding protein
MDLREYEQHKFAIADILRSASAIAPSEHHEWQLRVRDLYARLAEDRFNLVVVGRFNRGKTSLMNAILATDRLPTGIVPLTSVITAVAYGSKERVVLQYDERIFTEEVPIESLPRYITQQGNPGNAQRIKIAEVQLPAEILRRGFYFVDTPGLGSAIAESTRATENFLPEADAFLLVTSYESPLSDEEMRFFRSASSSAHHIFVVLNKHDTVSCDERKEALSYVHDHIRTFFGQSKPQIFSVSAHEGLEAKQAGDTARLDASGIPELEERLISFLLIEKQSEFLQRMCDRAAALVRELSSSDDVVSLIESIDALTKRIAQDHEGVTRLSRATSTSVPAWQKLNPCEVCSHITGALWEFLSRFQYELVINHEQQQRFAESAGLCSFHTWQLEAIASPQGICTGYPTLLDRLAARLRNAVSAESKQDPLSANIEGLLPTRKKCVLCQVQTKAESEAISAITSRLAENESAALRSLSAICLPHFAMLSDAISDVDLTQKLMDRQATILERLSEDMRRYALKHDAVRRFLASEEETTAAQRALMLLAGHRNVNTPGKAE